MIFIKPARSFCQSRWFCMHLSSGIIITCDALLRLAPRSLSLDRNRNLWEKSEGGQHKLQRLSTLRGKFTWKKVEIRSNIKTLLFTSIRRWSRDSFVMTTWFLITHANNWEDQRLCRVMTGSITNRLLQRPYSPAVSSCTSSPFIQAITLRSSSDSTSSILRLYPSSWWPLVRETRLWFTAAFRLCVVLHLKQLQLE